MNELTWRRVLEWEALHHDTCGDPKLLRFMGKPHDLRYESSTLLPTKFAVTPQQPFLLLCFHGRQHLACDCTPNMLHTA